MYFELQVLLLQASMKKVMQLFTGQASRVMQD